MFGDNKSVVMSSTIPHSPLSKRHQFLAYHRVRESIAAEILKFFHIGGQDNPADILSKHVGYSQIGTTVRSLLFWTGNTIQAPTTLKHKVDAEIPMDEGDPNLGEYQQPQSTASSEAVKSHANANGSHEQKCDVKMVSHRSRALQPFTV